MPFNLFRGEPHFDHPSGNSGSDRVAGDIARYHGTGSNNRTAPDDYAGDDDRTVADPDIILDDRLVGVASTRIPNSFSNDVSSVIIASDKSNLPTNENLAAESDIALHATTRPELDIVTEDDFPMGGPEPYTHGASDFGPMAHPGVQDVKLYERTNPVSYRPQSSLNTNETTPKHSVLFILLMRATQP